MDSSFNTFMKRYWKNAPVTTVLLGLNTLMLAVVLFTGGFTLENLTRLGGLIPSKLTADDEFYRILSAMFLHGSVIHFLANSYFLFHVGALLERLLGHQRFSLIYFLSGIGSGLLVWALGEPETVTIGASGALFGILGALLLLSFVRKSWFTPQGVNTIRTLTIINLIFTLIIPNISVWGHLGGFITGFILIFFLKPTRPRRMRRPERPAQQETHQTYETVEQPPDDDDDDIDDLFK